MLSLPPLSLYVHIPWCIKKCPYCDFNSHQASTTIPQQAYVQALINDLEADLAWVQGRTLQSIFFGGGTPSLFSGAAIAEILNTAEKLIGFDSAIEITLEANPGTVEQQKFADFHSAGVNRLSIGVQSFNDQQLQQLGRIHNGTDALNAIDTAKAAGFNNFNIDLMHGLPAQTMAQAEADIELAIESGAQHISWYQLTIEANTEFYSRPPLLPSDEHLADIQNIGSQKLQRACFSQYEVSAFALDGQRSKHNMNYWQFGDYLGIGAGAHGKVTLPKVNQVLRSSKTRQPDHYLSRTESAVAQQQPIANNQKALEFMMNGLRLRDGIPIMYFPHRTGLPTSAVQTQVEELQRSGLMATDVDNYRATDLGYQFLNTLLQKF